MALYYITGAPASGKSTILVALRWLGYEAYDVDEIGPVTAKWHNNISGYIHPKSSVKQGDRTPDFYAKHSWRASRQDVLELANQAQTKTIFLGGNVANQSEMDDLFRSVFALTASDETLERRLVARGSSSMNDWGKNPHEIEQTVVSNQKLYGTYKSSGYTLIDASQPVDIIVGQILDYIHDN